jgi:hypothetical protein
MVFIPIAAEKHLLYRIHVLAVLHLLYGIHVLAVEDTGFRISGPCPYVPLS